MTEDRRATATTPPRLALIISATLLGAMIAGVGVIGAEAIELPLTEAARDALRDNGISGVDVRFDGREAFLTPDGAGTAEAARAEQIVAGLYGVRWVTVAELDPAAIPSLELTESAGGQVTVRGSVGSEEQADALHQAAVAAFGPDTAVDLTVTDGVATSPWVETAPELFASLAAVHDLSFALDPDGATLTGSAFDPSAAEESVAQALGDIPLQADIAQSGPTDDEIAAINGTVILFVADSVKLDKRARAAVQDLAEVLRRYPAVEVQLTGHIAIPVGTEADAVAFSERRAKAVAAALAAAGVAPENLHIVGAGSSEPVGDNATEAGAAANRRVTVLIMEGS
jgi:outer membrane protein OmpA-like peptidoglycan-associated protein